MHDDVPMYSMSLPLIIMVQQPGVGMHQKFTLLFHPGDLRSPGASWVFHILGYAVPKDGQKVWVLIDEGIIASQYGCKSTKHKSQLTKYIPICLHSLGVSACTELSPGEGCALSPRQNVAPSVVYRLCQHASFALCLTTHILLYFGFDILGISRRFLLMASTSALVRAFLPLAEPPGMVLMLMPPFVLDVTSSKVSVLLSISGETHTFITPWWHHQALFWKSWPHCWAIWLVAREFWLVTKEQWCHLAGISSYFPTLLVQKGQMYSNLPRDRTCFHQLGACECECFCLAGIGITEGDTRQELIEILAASEYPDLLPSISVSSSGAHSQVPVLWFITNS